MRQALKQHILRKRQRLKQEIEQEAIEKRLKREKELKQIHDTMTLDQIKEQLTSLEKKLTSLRDEKHNLFVQLKQVLSGDSSRKNKHTEPEPNKSSESTSTSNDTSRRVTDIKQCALPGSSQVGGSVRCSNSIEQVAVHKPSLVPNPPITTSQATCPPLAVHEPTPKLTNQILRQDTMRAGEPIHMLFKQPTPNIQVQSQLKPHNLPSQLRPMHPILTHHQLNPPILATVNSLVRNDQLSQSSPTNLTRKNLARPSRSEGVMNFGAPSLESVPGDSKANHPLDFTQPRVPAHMSRSQYPFVEVARSKVPSRHTAKRPYSALISNEPILDVRKRTSATSHPSYCPSSNPILLNGPGNHNITSMQNINHYRSMVSQANSLQTPLMSPLFTHEQDYSRASGFKSELANPIDSHDLNLNPSLPNLSTFYPNIQASQLNYRPNFPVAPEGDLRQFAMTYSPMPQSFVNSVRQMNLQLPPNQNPYLANFHFPRKPFNPANSYHQNK